VTVGRELYPLTVPVTRFRRGVTGQDQLGNDVVGETSSEVLVFGYYSASPDEPLEAGHERLTLDARMITAVGDFVADDAVILPSFGQERFEVVGEAENYNANPWWSPGREIVNLRRSQR
jgi:hypothetical protein